MALTEYQGATHHPQSNWTQERIWALKQLWADGLSASQIAAKLGLVSRNAVIGKIHRLGLAGRKTVCRMPRAPRAPHAPRPVFVRLRKPKQQPRAIDFEPYAGPKVSLHDLTSCTCHWPHGDPLAPGFGFCGCPIPPGAIYCACHRAKAVEA
jgi:GcrA cell cycle regulator